MKLQSLSFTISSNITHSFEKLILMIFNGKYLLHIYKHIHAFYFRDDRNTLNYNLEFPNCYHQVKYLNQDTFLRNKLYQTLSMTSFAKLCAAMLLRFQWQIEKFFAVFCLGPWLSLTSPHSKSKLHLNIDHQKLRQC